MSDSAQCDLWSKLLPDQGMDREELRVFYGARSTGKTMLTEQILREMGLHFIPVDVEVTDDDIAPKIQT